MMNNDHSHFRPLRQACGLGIFLTVAALTLAGCGAGSGFEETKTGSGGTGMAPPNDPTTASGPATSLDPLTLAGNRVDDTSAAVVVNASSNRNSGDLRLGMGIEVSGEFSANSSTPKATLISAQSIARGPIRAIESAQQQISVLGVAATLDQNTLKDGFGSLIDLKPGDRVEVHGVAAPNSSVVVATRITALGSAAATEPVEVTGIVAALNGSRFQLRGTNVAATSPLVQGAPASASPTSSPLANGARVRAIGQLDNNGDLVATQVVATPAPERFVGALVTVDGLIQNVQSAPARVRINDVDIDVSSLPSATVTAMVVGTRAVVRGRNEATTMRASEARVIAASDRIAYQVSGAITDFTSRASFKVRGEQVNASTASFVGGTVTDLAAGKRVRVLGVAGTGSVEAIEVNFLP
jgi:hypothetical protein